MAMGSKMLAFLDFFEGEIYVQLCQLFFGTFSLWLLSHPHRASLCNTIHMYIHIYIYHIYIYIYHICISYVYIYLYLSSRSILDSNIFFDSFVNHGEARFEVTLPQDSPVPGAQGPRVFFGENPVGFQKSHRNPLETGHGLMFQNMYPLVIQHSDGTFSI